MEEKRIDHLSIRDNEAQELHDEDDHERHDAKEEKHEDHDKHDDKNEKHDNHNKHDAKDNIHIW